MEQIIFQRFFSCLNLTPGRSTFRPEEELATIFYLEYIYVIISQADHGAGLGICHSDHRVSRPHMHRFWMPHETSRKHPGVQLKGIKGHFHSKKILYFLLQKDEQPEEEKPLTLSNGITPGEPEENGKPQNGHIVLSPPVRQIFSGFLLHSFEFFSEH